MLIDERCVKIGAFEAIVAEVLGNANGDECCNVLAETLAQGRTRVELRDWLYCLAKAPGTCVHSRFIERAGKQQPQVFVDLLEGALASDDDQFGIPPDRVTSASVSPAVVSMLDAAERLSVDNGHQRVSDAALSLALLETADEDLTGLLVTWTSKEGAPDVLKEIKAYLRSRIEPQVVISIFGADGRLNTPLFSPSGRKFCKQLTEDARSLGVKKITTRHMLYTILSNEAAIIPTALTVSGIEVKRELHAVLARELVRPGGKRNSDLEITRDTVFDAVVQVFEEAARLAKADGRQPISEYDINRAFIAKQPQELARLSAGGKSLDIAALRAYAEASEYSEDDQESALHQYSIKEVEEKMNERICGQSAAVGRVIPWIKRLRYGIPRDGRPAAVFLFLGPTGTGKTQLSKELARYVFGDEDMVIFMEMGQFKTKESMNMFIGAPPGYIGYGDGKLTNGLRDKPESVVLFDEIEKADIQVFDTLLRFADEGVISDPAGPVRDGRKCLIVMTTNAGQQWLRDYLKSNPEAIKTPETLTKQLFDEAMKELQSKGFRPEFLGRVDERIVFLPFTLEVCRKIVDGVLSRDLDKFSKLKGVTIEVDDTARDVLAKHAFDRSMEEGARGAPRAVNDFIVTPAIDMLSEAEEQARSIPRLIATRDGINKVLLEARSE